jgi:Xaa-Pro aminopeptidase
MGIGMRPQYKDHDLKPGQCISNEPGYYKDGHWGIRIENLVLIKEVNTKYNFGGKWIGCERVTMAPIQTKMVVKDLMTPRQIKWLNDYNQEVKGKLTPLLKGDERALKYLEKECKAI